MVDTLITLVIYLVVLGLIWWAVTTILAVIPLPEPIKTVVNVVMIVILCLIVISLLLGLLPGHHIHVLSQLEPKVLGSSPV